MVRPVKYTINDLSATCKYYIRCTLKDQETDEAIIPNFNGEKYLYSEFYTIPHSFITADEPVAEEKTSGSNIKMKPVSLVCLGILFTSWITTSIIYSLNYSQDCQITTGIILI